MIFFPIIVIIVLLWSHYFIYLNLINIFSVPPKYKIIIFFILFLFASSFIISSIISHFYNNIFTRIFYYISSSWLWIASNLFFAFIFLALLIFVLKFFHINYNHKIIWSIFILFSILAFIYWVYNANNPVLKNVEIKINNLPKSWESKKIIMFSDLHLWAIIRENFLKKIISMINKENPDIVFIPWDFFDWTDWNLEHLKEEINDIKAKDWIYYVFWNHETYIWKEKSKKLISWTKIKLLNNEFIDIDWVQIVWIDYFEWFSSKQNLNQVFSDLEKTWFDKTKPSILLFHTPTLTEEFKNFWINLHLAWHTHKWQFWPYSYITSLIYSWKDHWLYTNWNYNLYTSNWIWTWWPQTRIWNSPEIVVLKLK